MRNCIWCGGKGVFLRVDQNNLCLPCQEKIYPDIKNKVDYLLYCYNRLKESKKIDVKTTHLKLLLETQKELKKYEEKNIPTTDIKIELSDVFANVEGPIFKISIDRSQEKEKNERIKKEMDELQEVSNEFGNKYGKRPDGYLEVGSFEESGKLLIETMDKYKKEGIMTLGEIEECIKNKKPFKGVHSLGMQDNDGYKIFVTDTIIYDSKNNYFDFQFKRFSMYSEIQQMIAKNIFHKDLAVIRREGK